MEEKPKVQMTEEAKKEYYRNKVTRDLDKANEMKNFGKHKVPTKFKEPEGDSALYVERSDLYGNIAPEWKEWWNGVLEARQLAAEKLIEERLMDKVYIKVNNETLWFSWAEFQANREYYEGLQQTKL